MDRRKVEFDIVVKTYVDILVETCECYYLWSHT